jgi:SAM-dependent methyltransferase
MPIRAFLGQALRDEQTYAWLTHKMGNDIAMSSFDIATAIPRNLSSIKGFEDCYWLYDSNPLNHGASRLRFDEAAFLYKLTGQLNNPKVAEIGRYKGGTALLLAAAGAAVTSLDNGRIPGQNDFSDSLITALKQVSLEDRVDVVVADALEYEVEPESYDLVFLDNGLNSFDMGRRFFEHWWETVRKGGFFIFRDGKDTVLAETARFVRTLSEAEIGGTIDFNMPGAYVLCTKRS